MTDDVDGPRLIRPEEFDEVLALVDRCFGYEAGGMRAHNPHCYDPDRPERHAIVRRGGRVVAHAACIPDTLVCGPDARLACWGVSGVATDPRDAGNGYMADLLSFWLDRMDEEGVPLAKLWGDRARYGRFGFETVGLERRYRLTERSFDPPDRDDHVSQFAGELGWIPDLHATIPYRVERTLEAFRILFDQRGLDVLVYEDEAADERASLAFTSSGRTRTVTEVAGDEAGVVGLLSYLQRAYYTDEIRVDVHPRQPVCAVLRPRSVDWTDHTHKQFRVNDLPAVLDALGPELSRRVPESRDSDGKAVTLSVEGTERGVRVRPTASGSIVSTPVAASAGRSVSRRDAARLLFDDGAAATEELPRWLREVALPVQFFVPRTEWV